MPFPFPTSTLYRWTTNLLNRSAPTDPEKVSGFRAGDPVPPLTMNDILGSISDWVQYLGNAFESAQVISFRPSFLAPWSSSSGVTVDVGLFDVRVENAGAHSPAGAGGGPYPFGGTVTSVEVEIGSTVVGTDNECIVFVTVGALTARWDKTIVPADAGTTVSLPLNAGLTSLPNDGTNVDLHGPFTLDVRLEPGTSSGDEFEAGNIVFNFS